MRQADEIFERYREAYGHELQECCLLIADEIQRAIGGEVVAGELTWYGGSCRRSHWWVDKNGEVIDPLGDWFLQLETEPGRVEHHRDRRIFESVLLRYEHYRVPPPVHERHPPSP